MKFSTLYVDIASSTMQNLRCAATDMGKTFLPEHLILLADCLSVTGEFVGLSAKGIARQKAHVSVSSPFMLACFTVSSSLLLILNFSLVGTIL